jgi:phosphatidylserine decarboxylase
MAKEGLLFVLIPFFLGVILLLLKIPVVSYTGAIILYILAAYFAFFFRDPPRRVSATAGEIVSPVDGTVLDIVDDGDSHRVVVFLSIFNVHVTRLPLGGTLDKVEYFKGEFLPAYREKASELNERITLSIDAAEMRYTLKLIAGVAARRIRMWVNQGAELKTGEKIGIIMFGSRAELSLPKTVKLLIQKGQKVKGGLTSFAKPDSRP